MIVVDIETTGSDPVKHSILNIGAINFNNPEDRFFEECRVWDGAHIDDSALKFNGNTLEQVSDSTKQSEADLITHFLDWIEQKEERTLGGQNPLFDMGFLQAAAYRAHKDFVIARRTIDLHSITYFHMILRELDIPLDLKHKHSGINSDKIMEYVGIPPEPRPHVGINGALWEAEAFHRLFYKKYFLEQFKHYPLPF
jgi:DNA polymerase III epsilon subunit-like protein